MTEKEIITKFINSDSFPIIHNYISRPYEETINEMQQDKDNFIKFLEEEIGRLNSRWKEFAVRINRPKDVLPRIEAKTSAYQDILERIRNNNYEN